MMTVGVMARGGCWVKAQDCSDGNEASVQADGAGMLEPTWRTR